MKKDDTKKLSKAFSEQLNSIQRMPTTTKKSEKHCWYLISSCKPFIRLITFRLRFMMGKYNQSLEIFLKAESCLQSPDHEVYHYIGDLLSLNAKHSKGNILDAKEYFRRSIMCGKQMETYKTLAKIYRKEKDFLKAIELLESCMRFDNRILLSFLLISAF